MKTKGKQTEPSCETSIKTTDTLRLSTSLHNSVFCRGAAWALCTWDFWSNYCATFSRKFRVIYIFLGRFCRRLTRKQLEEFCVWLNLLARVIELNNEILFPRWPRKIEPRAPIHRITSKHEVNQVERKRKNQFVRFYRALVISAERVGKSNNQVKRFNRPGDSSYDMCNFKNLFISFCSITLSWRLMEEKIWQFWLNFIGFIPIVPIVRSEKWRRKAEKIAESSGVAARGHWSQRELLREN